MDILETVLLILLVLVSVSLGGLVLIQQSKGADIGAAFGSGAANTLFGSSGATSFLVKFTAIIAIGFFLITFGLAYTASERAASLRGFDYDDSPSMVTDDGALAPISGDSGDSEGADTTTPLEGDELPVFEAADSAGEPESTTGESGSDEQVVPDI